MKPFFLFSKEIKQEGGVPNNEIFAYSCGLAGQNMTYGFVSNWLRYFCINLLHIDSLKVGTLFSASYVWDAINDPIIGAYVDRRNYKPYRKLRPYLIYLPPIIGLLSMFMFMNVSFPETGKVIYILILYFLWDFFYSFQDVGLWGMIALSSPHSEERSRVAQWVSIGAGAGSAVVGIFQQVRSMLTGGMGLDDKTVFFIFAIIFCLFGEIISMSAYRIKERVSVPTEKGESFFQSFLVLRHNPKLLLISLARFFKDTGPKVQNAYFFENCGNIVRKDGSEMIGGQSAEFIFGLASGIPGTFAIFFATKIAKKIGGMKKVLLVAQSAAVIIRLIAFFVGYDHSLAKFIIITVLIALINLPGNMMDIAHRSLTSDSIDEVELKTGIRSEGISFSMQNFTTKMTSGATALIEGVLLKLLKYDSDAKAAGLPQNALFLKWQWPMFMLGPVVGAILYLIVISFIKDDPKKRSETERLLIERRKKAEEESKVEANA